MSCTVVTQCVSAYGHTLFCARGLTMCHVTAADGAASLFPKSVTHSDPERIPPPEHWHQRVPSTAVLCQTLACRPHGSSERGTAAFSWRGATNHVR